MQNPKGMIDVGDKAVTQRTATATAVVLLGCEVFEALVRG